MLKNTKAVGIAAAITLLTGVALAPSASGVGQNLPELSVDVADTSVDAGERVTYSIDYVRTGCRVTTTLGSKTKVERATGVEDNSNKIIGEIVDAYITAPSVAGEYTMRSRVNSDCKSDAGFSNTWLMTDEITVGTEVTLDEDEVDEDVFTNWESLDNGGVRMFGWLETTGGSSIDLGAVKVNFMVKGKVVASGYTDDEGYVVASVAKRYLNNRGNTNVKVKLSSNRVYFMDESFSVERVGG